LRNKENSKRVQSEQADTFKIFDINRISNLICIATINYGDFYTSVFLFTRGVDTSSPHWDEIMQSITRNAADKPRNVKVCYRVKTYQFNLKKTSASCLLLPMNVQELSTLYFCGRRRKVDLQNNYFKPSHFFLPHSSQILDVNFI